MAKNELTKREKAAIRLYVLSEGDVGIADLYAVAYDGDESAVSRIASLPSVASRWWRSQKVTEYFNEQKAAFGARKEKERMRIESECLARTSGKNKDGQLVNFVDYSKPSNQMAKLNQLINTAQDPDAQLDALKVVIARQQELAPEKRTPERVHAYLPLRCDSCPLYKKEKEKLVSNNQ